MASNSRQRSRDEVDESHRNGFVSGWFLWLLGMYLSFLVEEHAISSPWTDWVEISQIFFCLFWVLVFKNIVLTQEEEEEEDEG